MILRRTKYFLKAGIRAPDLRASILINYVISGLNLYRRSADCFI